ncbi:NUP57 [Candida pseudojiufengensis]|uniref:NUP57 n=1 Tax=Candida pseudojiufengensis TaxID=497109 RepID=UPI00222420CC|nr:NUP57 [Candida pseudojiufengensis]KAI5963494.1 NUP57 [Candida pseudojiufengensis]
MFGASNNTSSGLFGSSNNNTNSSTGGGLFGNKSATTSGFGFGQSQQPQQPQQSNVSGQSNTTTGNTGGSLFGQSQNNNTATGTGGGLFGSNQQKSGSTGGLFGSSSTNTGTGFGASTGSGSLFGKPNETSTGGGLFGGNNTQQTSTTGGGLFGKNPQQTSSNTSGGLFGTNTQANSGTGGLFGQSNTKPAETTGGLFGNKPASTTTGGGLFGNSNTNTQSGGGLFGNKPSTTTSGGLFGTQQQQQQPQQQTSLFSSNTTNNQQPSFSWSQPQQNQPVVNNTSSLFGFNQNTNQPQNNQHTYAPAINDQLTKVWEQWDPNSPKCALKTHFYNRFNDQEIKYLLQQPRPSNETVEDWDKAMKDRPNQNSFPIKISSYDEVAQRIETQIDYISKEKLVLNQINERLNNLSAKHDLENTTRILKAKARHTQLSRRLLRLATVLATLKLKGYPLLPEEEEIARQFDNLTNKINDPNSPIGKLSDIFAKLNILKERAEDINSQFDQSIHVINNTLDNGSTDQNKASTSSGNSNDIIEKFTKILMKQQIGLNYLNDLLEKDFDKVEKSLRSKK